MVITSLSLIFIFQPRREEERPRQREKSQSMAQEAFPGNNNDLITKSWMASTRAYSTDHFHIEEERETVFVAFRQSFSANDWIAPENKSPFGETKMKRDQFPCMRSIGNDVDAIVNESFLKNLELLISPRTPFCDYVSKSFKLIRLQLRKSD